MSGFVNYYDLGVVTKEKTDYQKKTKRYRKVGLLPESEIFSIGFKAKRYKDSILGGWKKETLVI